jgi:hypothetical protein
MKNAKQRFGGSSGSGSGNGTGSSSSSSGGSSGGSNDSTIIIGDAAEHDEEMMKLGRPVSNASAKCSSDGERISSERGDRRQQQPRAGTTSAWGRKWKARVAAFLALASAASLVNAYVEYLRHSTGGGIVVFHGAAAVGAPSAAVAPRYLPTSTTYADTAPGQVCHQLFPWGFFPKDSFRAVWGAVRPFLLNESYHPFDAFNPKDDNETTDLMEFRQWTASLFDFYTHERLRRSQAHPAPVRSVRKILELVRDRIDDPEHHGPVRIAVMGGSVALGRGSQLTPYAFTEQSKLCWGECNYVSRLRHLLNSVIFSGSAASNSSSRVPIFEVTNYGSGGTNSEVGAMALEYHLIPSIEANPPHIVLSSYSVNDSNDPDLHKTFHVDQQAFIRAAHKLRPCDDDLPLIVLADDYYGWYDVADSALEQTGTDILTDFCAPCGS